MALGDGLDPEWFYRRRQFCEARIKAWTQPDRLAPPAGVVAGLHKEVAAIALIQGDMETARASLAQAGELLLKQTSAQGLVYFGLAGAHRVADDPLARTIIDVAARLDEPRNPDERRIKGTQYYAPLQWLSVVQAQALAHQDDAEASTLIKRLRPQGSIPLANGLPLGLYLDLLAPRDEASGLGDSRFEDFATVMSWRRRGLRIARENTYHWRTILDPVALVDFDLIALFLSRPIPGFVGSWAYGELDGDHLEWLPMIVADSLRGFGPGYLQTT
ncbi:MAG: hypothetical protein DI531_12005 [Brevundimonas sp.]|jgi:hypothetical protein|uniref:hypothetical protein n=1 Tax=Brevundimonas sp. TaxID=1871086 RepID=UPI000DB21F85|nr:hypothetical protein [Brevundimonas sp.]PZU72663.1 MAG: hypothetical protein DI531_12005 [Brevundimonas sp.]